MSTKLLFAITLLAPFLGFLINGVRFSKKTPVLAGVIATVASGLAFLASLGLVIRLAGLPESGRSLTAHFFDWIAVGDLSVPAGFMLDPINAVMVLVVTGIGTLIHAFSIGYMAHDDRPSKYFAYLNLFLFNMLLLILGDNLVVMFVGWEGVGLCSYLLIGFWFTDAEKAKAGMKAFITNRIGDAGFLLGMFVLFTTFGTLGFSDLAGRLPEIAESHWGPLSLAALFLFIGATGKSAQIPLYVWLPDAMAGPTPVSALIHAATMVTAGVYMIVRLSPLYILAPTVMTLIAVIGALTAVFAATIGLTQWDIKKVLAYSTVSQLGYMFLAVGVGAFGAAIFHLMTHAFFKALMFLGSGSVIHAMHEEQDIRKMGGLKDKLPITHWTFVCGWLAIIGTPGLAGFFSKDEILWMAWHSPRGSGWLWLLGLVGAALTAFYMTRLMALTFWGKSRVPTDVHPHESPPVMTIPLIVLAVLSVMGGWIGIPHLISAILPGHIPNVLEHWLKPVLAPLPDLAPANMIVEGSLMGVSVAIAALAALAAYWSYLRQPEIPGQIVKRLGRIYDLVSHKYFVDEFYSARFIRPLVNLSQALWVYVDVNFIDKITFWLSDLVVGVGKGLRNLQNGNIQSYVLYFMLGVVATLYLVFYGV